MKGRTLSEQMTLEGDEGRGNKSGRHRFIKDGSQMPPLTHRRQRVELVVGFLLAEVLELSVQSQGRRARRAGVHNWERKLGGDDGIGEEAYQVMVQMRGEVGQGRNKTKERYHVLRKHTN